MEERILLLHYRHRSQYITTLVAISMVWDKEVTNISNVGEIAAALAIEEGWAINLAAPIDFAQLHRYRIN